MKKSFWRIISARLSYTQIGLIISFIFLLILIPITLLVNQEKQEWNKNFWIISFGLFSLFLGTITLISFTRYLTRGINNLSNAMNEFSNGQFSTRLPTSFTDQIGILYQTFNNMAQKIQSVINQFYLIKQTIKSFAKGDFSARFTLNKGDNEFEDIAHHFNKIAESSAYINKKLLELGINLSQSAADIATASKEQETIIVEQEATTKEIAVAANEISATAKEFAATLNEMNQVANQTSNLAVLGKESLNNMESIMRQMVEASSSIASKLAVLNEKAGNITSVITAITKIADQTNLLSLNASIEAEKAGEYGRSFAVIAREIRRLADQTAFSTLDIEKIVNEIMTAVSSSVMGVDDFTQEIRNGVDQIKAVSGQLGKIIEQVQVFTGRFDIVNEGMKAQSTGAEQINEAIALLSQTAQQTTVSIHQFHKTIEELNNTAKELRNINFQITPE